MTGEVVGGPAIDAVRIPRRPRRLPAVAHRMLRDPLFRIGGTIVLVSLLLAVFGPPLAPYDPQSSTDSFSDPPPQLQEWPGLIAGVLFRGLPAPHWFGTDGSGLDIFSRVLAAPRADLTIALFASLISAGVGTSLGLLAGFSRGIVAEVVTRLSDMLQSFPVFITAMILVSLAGRNLPNIVLTLGLVYTPVFLRLTRAEVVVQITRGYVEAARALGNAELKVALRHVLPNSIVPSLIQLSTTVGFAILLAAGLSFVGAGVRPPLPEWGLMIAQGAPQMIVGEWWESVFPGIAVSATIFGYAAVGHALERAYD
jgi:peptide/nickel transport system permease protein